MSSRNSRYRLPFHEERNPFSAVCPVGRLPGVRVVVFMMSPFHPGTASRRYSMPSAPSFVMWSQICSNSCSTAKKASTTEGSK